MVTGYAKERERSLQGEEITHAKALVKYLVILGTKKMPECLQKTAKILNGIG